MDETPTVWGINPKFLFQLVNGGGRAAAPESDERARITTNVCICADGTSLPPSFIIKCSTAKDDQSRLQVLDTLLRDSEFNTDGKWTKCDWTRVMLLRKKASEFKLYSTCYKIVFCLLLALQLGKQGSKTMEKRKFLRQYLRHPDGRVVWAHPTGRFVLEPVFV